MKKVPSVMYEQIEQAIITRLREGLGNMVRQVVSYSGEMDDDLGAIVRTLPAVWVTFGGIQSSKQMNTSKNKLLCTGTFAVMVATQNVRSDAATRQTERFEEVGSNTLIYAVRRLLAYQELGLSINPLVPTRVRSLFNTRLANLAVSGYACEFEVQWIEEVLPDTTWPVPQEHEVDTLYQLYGGRVDKPAPDLICVDIGVINEHREKQLQGLVQTRNKDDESNS